MVLALVPATTRAENELQTPPSGLETEFYSVKGYTEIANWGDGDYSPLVAIDGNTMWVKNLVWYATDVWVKGTIIGNQVVFEKGQYLGRGTGAWNTPFEHTYLAAWDSDNNIVALAFDYDAAAKKLYLNHLQFGGSCGPGPANEPVEQVDGDDEWKTHGWSLQGTGKAGPKTGGGDEPEDDGHPTSADGTPVPVSYDLTREETLASFTVVDANNDGTTWKWASSSNCVWYYSSDKNNADDWLITPAILLEAGKTYKMFVNSSCQVGAYPERMELAYGVAPRAGSMRRRILDPFVVNNNTATDVTSDEFSVTETGDYYLGVHCISDKDMYALRVYGISVVEVSQTMTILEAKADPDGTGYYTTFYDSEHAYVMPDDVTAYTASLEEQYGNTVVRLTTVDGNMIPKGVAVLLQSMTSGRIRLRITEEEVNAPGQNEFRGVDEDTDQGYSINYMFSFGEGGLGFYRMNEGMKLSAHKAFLPVSGPAYAPAFRVVLAK